MILDHINTLNNLQKPVYFRSQLTLLFLEIHKITSVDFKQIFMTVIDTITTIIANQIREVSLYVYMCVFFNVNCKNICVIVFKKKSHPRLTKLI